MSVYSPRLRTALVLAGSGTAGAYHAGVLRALREAGVKIDIVCGAGVGVAGALYAALDGGPRLWEADGIWRAPGLSKLYGWRASLRAAAISLIAALAALAAPAVLLIIAAVMTLISVVLGWAGLDATSAVVAGAARAMDVLFRPAALPALVPRLAALACLALLLSLAGATISAPARRRRRRGGWWWWPIAAPLTARGMDGRVRAGLWRIIRGAAPMAEPSPADLSRRYAEMLADNLGQPGFCELIVTVHDLDARRDLVFALLVGAQRKQFFARGVSADARSHPDLIDLSGVGREHALDALGGAVRLPGLTDPHAMTFAPESYWRGEVHRLYSRPDALGRLLHEAHAAAVKQVIIVTADSPIPGPHTLSAARWDLRGRASDELAAAGVGAVRDALTAYADRFQATFVIRPSHNPLGPLDFGGGYDEHSDRRFPLGELIDRGYEDAYRQFIEPIVGAEVAEGVGQRSEA